MFLKILSILLILSNIGSILRVSAALREPWFWACIDVRAETRRMEYIFPACLRAGSPDNSGDAAGHR
jgi:hypothetical protein